MSLKKSTLHDMVLDHMKEQPYKIVCYLCGKELEYTKVIDLDLDLMLDVKPCDCQKEDK